MLEKKHISAYSVAIFDLVQEENKLKELHKQFEAVKDLFLENKSYIDFFSDHTISEEERFKTIDLAFKSFDWIIINSLKIILRRKSFKYIVKILIEYLKLSNKELRIRYLDVISAYPLSNEQLQAIKNKLQLKTRRTIEITNHVDKSLIAGFKIVSRTETHEMSIKNDLENLKYDLIKHEKEV
ncbi:ATP synthase F1 subunit delta [Mycoplasmopsis felis]|uniref:ATP synthase F1 subunit delta n=1 Tax=Mycoplasmopsis felis TaxID=33923 RepID=UPI00055BF14D|nr:ATP synthase F1 subunit delta [Mycoplasmopsis felis]WQQ02054.1 ATP synthase F1 subunit delta [Mycoplasmopsis felis]WQQ02519.1 ATP synthase F1 subunit delta [Mycoplasmopsis felis]WQQ03540.1 ATP synthase F1 subunit delta [Mycoplasmopsis felis]WQQ04161.1 ATP synthase F1 subunit delta [Mycoplasmopsis felis]WQQ05811.1 ATP synthase F1 subunit delta [Mycoplasmopsis felis]